MAEEVNESSRVPKTREVFVNEEKKTRAHKFGPKKLFENEGEVNLAVVRRIRIRPVDVVSGIAVRALW